MKVTVTSYNCDVQMRLYACKLKTKGRNALPYKLTSNPPYTSQSERKLNVEIQNIWKNIAGLSSNSFNIMTDC
jgi:hypothetical protein